jgi:predicted esterase
MTKTLLNLALAVSLTACAKDDGDDSALSAGDDTAAPAGDDTATPAEWSPPTYSGGACPLFRDGTNDAFLSDGNSRSFDLVLPENPEGAPIVFAWHWLGGSAGQVIDYMNFNALSEAENVIVVAPQSDRSMFEWHISDPADDNTDLVFFDDMVSCLYEQFNFDPNRIHATGMSAGGLWTTYLTVYRSEILASTAPLSGGVETSVYVTPARALPVMVVWGGSADTYGTFSFDTASRNFSASLQADGHFVVECMHTGGHSLPPDGAEFTWQFFKDHPMNVDPLPYLDGLPDTLPSFCALP